MGSQKSVEGDEPKKQQPSAGSVDRPKDASKDASKDQGKKGTLDEEVEKLKTLSLEEREARRYRGTTVVHEGSDDTPVLPVSAMYYPAGVDLSYSNQLAAYYGTKLVASTFVCPNCQQPSDHSVRMFQGESVWCVSCLKRLWFSGTTTKRLPHDVLMVVFSFCPDYHSFAHWCRVNRAWFTAANYDFGEENTLTAVKRKLIAQELYIQRRAWKQRQSDEARSDKKGKSPVASADSPYVEEFVSRMRLAPILGEWSEDETTIERRIKLCKLMLAEPYFVGPNNLVNINLLDSDEKWTDGEHRRVLHVTEKQIYSSSTRTLGELWVYAPKQGTDRAYVCFSKKTSNKWAKFCFDRLTGLCEEISEVSSPYDPRSLSERLGFCK